MRSYTLPAILYVAVNRQISLYKRAEGGPGEGGEEVKQVQVQQNTSEDGEKGMKLRGTESILSGDLS